MKDVFFSDHFLLGLGLATGPAIIICFGIYVFFKWVKPWKDLLKYPAPGMCGESAFCLAHAGLIRDSSFTIDECKSIWLEIKEVNHRQMSLRERLPKDYVSKDDLTGIQERLKSIDGKLDRYMEFNMSRK